MTNPKWTISALRHKFSFEVRDCDLLSINHIPVLSTNKINIDLLARCLKKIEKPLVTWAQIHNKKNDNIMVTMVYRHR